MKASVPTVEDVPSGQGGLEVLHEIGRGARSVVSLGTWRGRQVAVKRLLAADGGTLEDDLRQLRWEAAALARAEHPSLPKLLDVGVFGGRPCLLMEYVEGRTLAEHLAQGPLPVADAVRVARTLALGLAQVHRLGLTHRDLKPENVLITKDRAAKLLDFGFSATSHLELPLDTVVGTLRYASPEQAGVLKRPVDGRSDLYALGVVLFECLTGHRPFEAPNLEALLRLHATALAPDLRSVRPDLPPALAAVVGKLLQKDPDDRYPSADAVVSDLDRLGQLTAQLARGGAVALGAPADGLDPLLSPLVGRSTERGALERVVLEALSGRGGFALVTGEPGMGKTHLARAVGNAAARAGRRVLVAKCDEDGATPFGPLRRALEALLPRAEAPADEAALRARLEPALQDFDVGLPVLAPALVTRLGLAHRRPSASPGTDFAEAAAAFLARLASALGGLLLQLEDVQWADGATQKVLQALARIAPSNPVCVLVTCRSDAASQPGLQRFAQAVEGALVARVELKPLELDAFHALVSSHLGAWPVDRAFVEQLYARTLGSPLALGESLRALLEAGLLWPSDGAWRVDRTGLERLELPTDILQLVAQRGRRLSGDAHALLQAAAVLGGRFEVDFLTRLTSRTRELVSASVAEAAAAQLIEALPGGGWGFVHDRVREAFLAELSTADQRATHHRIAEALERDGAREGNAVFSLAHHYSRGEVEKSPERAFRALLAAGWAALAQRADEDASTFLQRAAELSPSASAPERVSLEEALGEVCFRTGKLPDAIAHLERAVQGSEGATQRASLSAKLARLYVINLDNQRARDAVEQGFRALGRVPPGRSSVNFFRTLRDWAWVKVLRVLRQGGARLTPEEREQTQTLVRLYDMIGNIAYFQFDDLLSLQAALRCQLPAHLLGPSHERVRMLAGHGGVLAILGFKRGAMRYLAEAEAVARQIQDPPAEGYAHFFLGVSHGLLGDPLEAERVLQRCLQDDGRWLDADVYLNASADLAGNLQWRGYCEESWSWVQRALRRELRLTRNGEKAEHPYFFSFAVSLLGTLGRPHEAREYIDRFAEFAAEMPMELFQLADFASCEALFYVDQGELGAPLEDALARFRRIVPNPRRAPFHLQHFYLTQLCARRAQLVAAGDRRSDAEAALRRALRDLKAGPAKNPLWRCHGYVAEATLERLGGRPDRALRWLAKADALAREVDSPWATFEAAVERARLHHDRGHPAASLREAQLALALATRHGWAARARKLRLEFREVESGGSSISLERRDDHQPLAFRRHLDALLQVSVATATALEPAKQAQVALDEMVRVLGAERAFFFLSPDDGATLKLAAGRDAQGRDLQQVEAYSSTVVERVRTGRRRLIVTGTEEGAALGSASAVVHGLRSIMAAPVFLKERLMGVVYLDNRLARGAFTEEDQEVFSAIASHIAVGLETARAARLEVQVESEKGQRRLAEALKDFVLVLAPTLSAEEVLDRLLDALAPLVPFDRALVDLALPPQVHLQTSRGGGASVLELVARRAASAGKAQVVLDSDGLAELGPELSGHHLESLLRVPVRAGGAEAGFLVFASQGPRRFQPHHVEIAEAFCSQAVAAVERARLFAEVQRLASTDALTGLANRRSFFALGAHELRRAVRTGEPFSAVMLDIDRFKHVNDAYGHSTGDEVLRQVAHACQTTVRSVDVLGRYGGEEFALLLPQTPLEGARVLAERLREAVERLELVTPEGEPLKVTVSLGVAEWGGGDDDVESVLMRADGALYVAKRGGRNRVELDRSSAPVPAAAPPPRRGS